MSYPVAMRRPSGRMVQAHWMRSPGLSDTPGTAQLKSLESLPGAGTHCFIAAAPARYF